MKNTNELSPEEILSINEKSIELTRLIMPIVIEKISGISHRDGINIFMHSFCRIISCQE